MTLTLSPIATAATALSPQSLDINDIIDIAAAMSSGGSLKPDSASSTDVDGNKENATSDNQSAAAAASSSFSTAPSPSQAKKHVRFDVADVFEFEPSAWTATVSSDGIPIGMSSTLRRRTRRRLDSLESERSMWRVRREEYMEHGYLEPFERLAMLERAGHAPSVISFVEKETVRINRERWESNEYDLLHQYGLGDVPLDAMQNNDSDAVHDNEGLNNYVEYVEEDDDDDDELMFLVQRDSCDDDNNVDAMQLDGVKSHPMDNDVLCYTSSSSRNSVLVDAEVRFAMEEIDAYDTHRYDELTLDYAMLDDDCILGDDDASSNADETNELPYAKDSFESPLSFALSEMSSSPTDVSSTTDALLASCATGRTSKSVTSGKASSGAAMLEV